MSENEESKNVFLRRFRRAQEGEDEARADVTRIIRSSSSTKRKPTLHYERVLPTQTAPRLKRFASLVASVAAAVV